MVNRAGSVNCQLSILNCLLHLIPPPWHSIQQPTERRLPVSVHALFDQRDGLAQMREGGWIIALRCKRLPLIGKRHRQFIAQFRAPFLNQRATNGNRFVIPDDGCAQFVEADQRHALVRHGTGEPIAQLRAPFLNQRAINCFRSFEKITGKAMTGFFVCLNAKVHQFICVIRGQRDGLQFLVLGDVGLHGVTPHAK